MILENRDPPSVPCVDRASSHPFLASPTTLRKQLSVNRRLENPAQSHFQHIEKKAYHPSPWRAGKLASSEGGIVAKSSKVKHPTNLPVLASTAATQLEVGVLNPSCIIAKLNFSQSK